MIDNIVIVLGDQLSPKVPSLKSTDQSNSVILIAEVRSEATYVKHHKKKIAFLFSAMRHFADELRGAGWTVRYIRLDDPENSGSLGGFSWTLLRPGTGRNKI
ncbi:MAG: cryptochrome/photolyase family protein [Sphingomonadales bacterium]|nr:cryptochrome/photolyase family protein [Sphingomonadaceae bacterium]MBS3930912.1 cryptochrome/photolyase family protein [Sphingomonadales bacterium]